MNTQTLTKPVENLTKENFWSDMHQKFPKAMTIFCEWIDQYKKKHRWKYLFNEGAYLFPDTSEVTMAPKYHDLPFAMQIGIWMEFVYDQGIYWVFNFSSDLKTDIRDFLAVLEVK